MDPLDLENHEEYLENHEEHLENHEEHQRIHTHGRERGKWVVKVIDSNGNQTEERLNAQDIWGMENRRVIVEFSPYDQPEEGSGGILGTWLGMLSTDLNKFPITYDDWRKVPTWRKDDAWDYIQSKFYFDASNENQKKFVMKSLSQKCKGVKTRLWQHFRRNTPEESIQARPEFIPKEQWQDFVYLQFGEKSKKLREQNKKSKSHHKTPHTLGKKSIARKSKEILLETGKRPSRGEMFLVSRKRANGNFVNDEARELSEKLRNASGSTDDEFSQVFGAERPGRVRCVGLGPTPSTYFKKRTSSATNETEVVALKNRVHDLEEKLEKMNDLEDRLKKMNDALTRLASSDCNCKRN